MVKYIKRILLSLVGKSLNTAKEQSTTEHVIEYYDSAETYPYKRGQKYYKFMAQDSEIGDKPLDLVKRLDRALVYNEASDKESVATELSNLRMAFNYMINEYSPIGAAAAISVKSIDGQRCDDVTTDGLEATLQKLSDIGLTEEDIRNQVETIKKKSNWNWRYIIQRLSKGKM